MAAPIRWENGNAVGSNDFPGSNSFRQPYDMHQQRLNQGSSNFRNFSPNESGYPNQINRFNRPNFTPPTQRPTGHRSFLNKPVAHEEGMFFRNIANVNRTPDANPNVQQGSMPQGNFINNRMTVPPSFQMGPQSHQNVNVRTPQNFGFLNNPPPPSVFNPNIPPPMPNQFVSPPGGMMGPELHQLNRLPFSQQSAHTNQSQGILPPSNKGNQQLQDSVSGVVSKVQEEQNRKESQRTEDEKWVSEWIKGTEKTLDTNKEQTITVTKTQEKTRHMIVLLARLQKGKQDLESMKNEDKSIWEQKLKEVMQIKTELEMLHQDLTSEETVSALKQRVDRTRKKRERIKRRKMEEFERRREELEHREEVHARMDKDIHQVIEKQRLKKQEEEMKKEADQILGQVRKKISDANKTIQLLNGIEKLRNLRKDRLTNQGILSMYESQGESSSKSLQFEGRISDMVSLLNTQLETYKAEEETLKVILETEQEETREKEREKALQKQQEKQRLYKQAEHKMLFGSQKDPKPGDPLFPFWQYYCMAENSLDALVSIRRDWDMYLTLPNAPGSSCIPAHWVIPPEPSSDVWSTALMDAVP